MSALQAMLDTQEASCETARPRRVGSAKEGRSRFIRWKKPFFADPNETNPKHFYVGGVLIVTDHPEHGPSLVVFQHGSKKNVIRRDSWETPQGKFEKDHQDILETARAELLEESCGLVDIDRDVLSGCEYIDLPNSSIRGKNNYSRFYVVRIDHEALVDPQQTFDTNLCLLKEAEQNGTFDHVHCYLEMNNVGLIALETLNNMNWALEENTTLDLNKTVDDLYSVEGFNGSVASEFCLWILHKTLVSRGIDSNRDPTGYTGLELSSRMFDSDVIAATTTISYEPSRRKLSGTELGDVGLMSIHVSL